MTAVTSIRTRSERWLGVFAKLRPGEGRAVLLFMCYGFLVMFSYYMLKTLREPLLLAKATAETKSYAYAVIALVLLFAVPAYGALFRRVSKAQVSLYTNLSLITIQFIFLILSWTGLNIGFAYYVWVGLFGVLITTQFWAFATDTLNVKTGQRVFPVIMIGVSLGGLVGPVVTGHLFQILGPQQLMMISLVTLSLMLPLIGMSRDAMPYDSRSQDTAPDPGGQQFLGGFALVFKNKYLLLLAALIVLLNWVNTTGEYILAEVVVDHANKLLIEDPGLDRGNIIAGFYGNFFSIVNALSLFMQMFIVSRVFQWIGVHGAILILPVIAFLGYGLMAFVPIFSMIQLVKMMENGTDYSLMNTARHALYLPLSSTEKYQAKLAIDAFFWRVGDLVQACVVYVGLTYLNFQVEQFAMLNMVLALVWLGVALRIGQQYVAQKKALSSGEPPRLTQPLSPKTAPAGAPLVFQLPVNLFYCEPGDVLSITVRLVDGGSLPLWLSFDPESLVFEGTPPVDVEGNTWLTVRATNMEHDWTETRLGFMH